MNMKFVSLFTCLFLAILSIFSDDYVIANTYLAAVFILIGMPDKR